MKAKILKNFKAKYNGKIKSFKIGEVVELEGDDFIQEHVKKKLVEMVPIMDTQEEPTLIEKLKKMNNKSDVIKYAESVGVTEINKKSSRAEIEAMIISHVENDVENADVVEYLTHEELQDLDTEDNVIDYAMSLGLEEDVINNSATREELEVAILEHIESLKVQNDIV